MEIKKRGRPPLCVDGTVGAFTMLPVPVYDSLYRRSQKNGVSISRLIREWVIEYDKIEASLDGVRGVARLAILEQLTPLLEQITNIERENVILERQVYEINREIAYLETELLNARSGQ